MVIECKYEEVIINNKVYRNRPININNVITFDKKEINNRDAKNVPIIRFTSTLINKQGKGELFDWLFESEKQRDEALETIKSKLGISTPLPFELPKSNL